MAGGALVREARRRAGLTQSELAARAGTTQSAVARVESGRTSPSYDMVMRLVGLCGFTPDIHLEPDDAQHDLSLATPLLRMDPQQRADHHDQVVAVFEELREAGRVARAG